MKSRLLATILLSCIGSSLMLHAGTLGIDARYIRVIKSDGSINPADPNFFHIGEVEVFPFGVTPAAGIDNTNDLALATLGALATTVSGAVQHGADANLISGMTTTAGNTWSRQNPLPIIAQVDLGATALIGEIRVWQRVDCCPERLAGFAVELLADNGGSPGEVVFRAEHPGQVPATSFASFETTYTGAIWTGATDDDWTLGSNWDLNRPPLPDEAAIFTGNTPGQAVVLGGTRSIDALIFVQGASDFVLSNGVLVTSNILHGVAATNTIDVLVQPTNELALTVWPGGDLILADTVENDLGLSVQARGRLVVNGPLTGAGLLALDAGTLILSNSANDFTGDVLLNDGVLQVTTDQALGSTNGRTRVGPGALLELQGAFDYLSSETVHFIEGGRLLSTGGDTTAELLLQGRVDLAAELGSQLTLTGSANIHEERLVISGEGDVEISGDLIGADPGLGGLDLLPTGDYPIEIAETNFVIHIDQNDEGSWLLIGRGREGWEFDADGQGAVSKVYQQLGTTNAFAPAVYSEALINAALERAGLRADQLEIRIRRAFDQAGTVYQEVRWIPLNQSEWFWDLDTGAGRPVRMEIKSGTPGGLYRDHFANTANRGANDLTRIFTFAWTGHNSQKGFGYGGAVTNGSNAATSFMWEFGDEQHPLPYTEVYIRSLGSPPGLVKRGSGTLTLSGDNSFLTELVVEEGQLRSEGPSNQPFGSTLASTIVMSGAELVSQGGRVMPPEPIILDDGATFVRESGDAPYTGAISLAPLKPAIRSSFSGGDVGEGLDLDGDFVYAVNVRGPGGLQVRDALFLADTNAPGVLVEASREILGWKDPQFGDTGDDDNLEVVMQSIRWGQSDNAGGIVRVGLGELTPGTVYRLQLLFYEPTNPNRGYDVLFDGTCIYDDFTAGLDFGEAAVLTYDFEASSSNHVVKLEGRGAPFADTAPILQGFTLERNVTITRPPGRGIIDARSPAFNLLLQGPIELSGSELELTGAGNIHVDVILPGFGDHALRKTGAGTAVLNRDNTFTGEVLIEEGRLVVTTGAGLGVGTARTTVETSGVLALDGANASVNLTEDLQLSGTLLNLIGTNVIHAASVINAPLRDGLMRIHSTTGQLTVLSDVDLATHDLTIDAEGDVVLSGNLSNFSGPILPTLNLLDMFNTGDFAYTAAGETFTAHVDNDGTDAWLLIGRGREGWEFDEDGQGAVTNVFQHLETTNAFAPAAYSSTIINDLLDQNGLSMADIEVRLKRAADIDGLTYQESRWRNFTRSAWTWKFDSAPLGIPVEYEILTGFGAGLLDDASSTRDGWPKIPGNDPTRVFTWAWGGHGNQRGFSYGGTAQGVDNNNPSTFMWEFANEGHAMPYTEVYIRNIHAEPITIGSSLSKTGSGSLTLAGMNTYFGDTSVVEGRLMVNNTVGSGTGSGQVLVASGATLGGSGSVSGTVTVTSGAKLAPGRTIGTFTANGGMNFALPGAATTVTIELASALAADQLALGDRVDLQGVTLDVQSVMGFTPDGTESFTILTASGGVSGIFAGLADGAMINIGGVPFTINYGANDVTLTSSGVNPDPPEGLSVVRNAPGIYEVQFMGQATTRYTIQFTETLSPPAWENIGTVGSDGTGLYSMEHTFAGPRGYYRSVYP